MQFYIFLESRLENNIKIEICFIKKHSKNAYLFLHIVHLCTFVQIYILCISAKNICIKIRCLVLLITRLFIAIFILNVYHATILCLVHKRAERVLSMQLVPDAAQF